jgi:hypothetical protein
VLRLECPACATSYTAERCGVPALTAQQSARVTVICVMCKASFDVEVTPKTRTETPGWWARTVLRRAPVVLPDGHSVVSAPREG